MSYPRSLPSINDSRRGPPQVTPSLGCPPSDALFNSATLHSSYTGFSSLARDSRQGLMSSSTNPCSPHQYDYRGDSRSRYNPSIFPRNRSPTSQGMDENQNPILDEAVQFVSSSRNVLHKEQRRTAVEFVREHFKCPVCLDVMIEATGIKCGHIFCRRCIQNWSATKSTCPVCGEDVSTVGLKLYDIDNAIESVSFLLSDEWKTRRMLIERMNESEIPETENPSPFDFTDDFREGFSLSLPSLQYLENTLCHVVAWFWQIYEWIRGHLSSIEGVAIGVLITCVAIVLFFFMSDHIINFAQYMYYALTSYRWNSPIEKQLVAVQHNLEQSKYQKFSGPDNTIFVRYIKLFYEY